MSITRINTNYDAMFARNQLKSLEASISRTSQRLSTGKRINSASDDPAGVGQLSVATAQMRGNAVAVQNLQEVKALADFQDSALASTESYLMQMRDISVRMANDATVNADQMADLTTMATTIKVGLDNVISGSTWKGVAAIDGGIVAGELAQIGPNATDTYVVGAQLSINVALTVATPNSAASALTAIDAIDVDLEAIAGFRAQAGGVSRMCDFQIDAQMSAEANNAATVSAIGDADMAAEVSKLAASQVLAQAAAAMVTQASNLQSSIVMSLIS